MCVFFVEIHVLCSASKLPNHDQGYCHYYTFLRSLHFAIPRAYALYNCGGGALDLDLTNFTHGGGGRKKELRKRIPRGEPKSITFSPFLPGCCYYKGGGASNLESRTIDRCDAAAPGRSLSVPMPMEGG